MTQPTVRFVVEKPGRGEARRFYWYPPYYLRQLGFRSQRLSDDPSVAAGEAAELNRKLDLWRRANRGLIGSPRVKPEASAPTGVYVIADVDQQVKIGIATDPSRRLTALQSSHARRLRLLFWIDCGVVSALAVEQTVHLHFLGRRLEGEWFKVTPREAINVILSVLEELATRPQAPMRRLGPQHRRGRPGTSQHYVGLLPSKSVQF